MFKSVFFRLLTTYLIITILVVATLTFIVASIYKDAIFSEKRHNLEAIALKVISLTQDFKNNTIKAEELNAAVNAMGYSSDAIIYALEIDKAKLAENQLLKIDGLNDTFVPGDIFKILKGETVFRNKEYSKDFGTNVLFTGYPLKVNDKIIGAVLIFCPISDINQNIAHMNLIIWLAALFVIMASIPFIYLNSIRISKPIRQLERAARKIAEGEKPEDTKIISDDEIGKLSHSFNNMRNQIEKTERVRRELIANISHDLRTPLTSIHGFVQGMLEGLIKPEDQYQYLKIIQEETNRLIQLTSDILDLAKIESENVKLSIESVNISSIIETVLPSFQLKARDKAIHIDVDVENEITVAADPEKLKQIFNNLFSNALKFTVVSGHIEIKAESLGKTVRLSIKDNGIGISKEDLPFVFEKFFRADQSRRSEAESTGLGLSIVKNLVMLMNGTIGVESEEGVGTTVSFELPTGLDASAL